MDHFEKVQDASGSNSHIDVQTAEAIVDVFHFLVKEWDNIPSIAQSWCKAMMRYFTTADGIEDDFNSPIGFDDDAEVVNACLKFAGRADLCLDVETVQEKPKLPPKPKVQKTDVNNLFSFVGATNSIILDFLLRISGKSDCRHDFISMLPIDNSSFKDRISAGYCVSIA